MPSSRRFHILAVLVFAAGIAAALAAAGAGAWAWATPGTLVFFRIALPLLAVWMLVVLGRLALALRRRVGADRDDDWRDPLRTLLSQPRRVPDAAMRAVRPTPNSASRSSCRPSRKRPDGCGGGAAGSPCTSACPTGIIASWWGRRPW